MSFESSFGIENLSEASQVGNVLDKFAVPDKLGSVLQEAGGFVGALAFLGIVGYGLKKVWDSPKKSK